MGVNKGYNEIFCDMTFTECGKCNTVQIKELINPELVYIDNHNISIVGDLWKNHYVEFIEFLKPKIKNSTVLEIGDPSFKLSNELSINTNKWFVVELNPNHNLEPPKNVEIITQYFSDSFTINQNVDVIVHSHFLEHVQDIKSHLKTSYRILTNGGKLIFSVPNLEKILNTDSSPNNVLHFDQQILIVVDLSYFYTKENLIKIIESEGFKLIETFDYKNHSLFFHFEKTSLNRVDLVFEKTSNIFIKKYENYINKINFINQTINDSKSEVFLYGAHVSSQFLISIGLNIGKINYILDNSVDKQNYKLYGTNLIVKPTEIITQYETPLIIVSHMSVYKDEIKEQILKINQNVKFL